MKAFQFAVGGRRVESLFVYFQSRPTISVTFGRKNTAHKYRKNILEGTISRWQMEKCVSGELLREKAWVCHDPPQSSNIHKKHENHNGRYSAIKARILSGVKEEIESSSTDLLSWLGARWCGADVCWDHHLGGPDILCAPAFVFTHGRMGTPVRNNFLSGR